MNANQAIKHPFICTNNESPEFSGNSDSDIEVNHFIDFLLDDETG